MKDTVLKSSLEILFLWITTNQVRCCPVNDEIVTVVGDGFAKTFKTSESSIRQVSTTVTNQEGQKIFCHAWLPPVAEVLSKKENQESKDKANKDKKEKEKEKGKKEKEKEQDEDPEKEVYCGCVYARASGELLYVEDGEVGFYLALLCTSTCFSGRASDPF